MNGLETATCDLALPPAGSVPEWVHLLPSGPVAGRDGRSFDLPDPSGLILAFQASGIDLPVDYEHQNDKAEAKLNGPVPAAGWIKELRSEESGIWGRVEWTATAHAMIGRKEYRYLSPSFLFHPRTRQIVRLKGAGLVHNPNLYLTALAIQEDRLNLTPVDKGTKPAGPDIAEFGQALADLLGLPPTARQEDILAALKERLGAEPDPAKYMPVTAAQSMLVERMQERRTISADRTGAKVDQAMRDGYLTAGMKPWALALCASDEAAFDSFIQSAGPVFPHLHRPSHTSALPPSEIRHGAGDSPVALAICEQLGLKPGSLSD